MRCPQTSEDGDKCPITVVNGDCELLCSFWELDWSPLEEIQFLLTTEESLQHPKFYFK